jgi:hypothetical protein
MAVLTKFSPEAKDLKPVLLALPKALFKALAVMFDMLGVQKGLETVECNVKMTG